MHSTYGTFQIPLLSQKQLFPLVTNILIHFQGWIIVHYHRIHEFWYEPSYIEDYPCVCLHLSHKRNDVMVSLLVYINQT